MNSLTDVYNWIAAEGVLFGLVFLRTSSFVVTAPLTSLGNIPAPIKILFALVVTICVAPLLGLSSTSPVGVDAQGSLLILLALREVLIGLILGFVSRFLIFAVSICGQIIALSMGLSNAQMFNPQTGSQNTAIEAFQGTLALVIFLTVNGHHLFLRTFIQSYDHYPLGQDFDLKVSSFWDFVVHSGYLIEVGLKLSFPILAAIFIVNIAMSVVGRAVPQINLLITSLPIQILVGLFVIIISMPSFLGQIENLIPTVNEDLMFVLKGGR